MMDGRKTNAGLNINSEARSSHVTFLSVLLTHTELGTWMPQLHAWWSSVKSMHMVTQ